MTWKQTLNEDWVKTLSWDLPTTFEGLADYLGFPVNQEQQNVNRWMAFRRLVDLPTWAAAPIVLVTEINAYLGIVAGRPDTSSAETRSWDEGDHPRGSDGKFGEGGGGNNNDSVRTEVQAAKESIQSKAAQFRMDGGKVSDIEGEAHAQAIQEALEKQQRDMGVSTSDKGLAMCFNALNEIRDDPYTLGLMATVDGDIAGVVSYVHFTDQDGVSGVQYMGSTQIATGAGSAMFQQVIRETANNEQGLVLDSLPGAVTFWRDQMGMQRADHATGNDPGKFKYTAEEVQYLAGNR